MATDLERLVVSLEANIKKFEREMARSRSVTDTAMREVERSVSTTTSRIENLMSGVGRSIRLGLTGALAGISIGNLTEMADSFTKIQNQLKVGGLEGKKLADTYQSLFDIAQKQGAPLEALATLYGRVSGSQKELNTTSAEMLKFTNAVALALRVNGTSATESSGALLQLAQALGGGKIQAEEFNSLIDGARPLLQAAAAGIKEAGGSVATLTTLVKDGKVSSEAFFRGVLAGTPALERLSASAKDTSEQAMTRLRNAMVDLVGKFDASTGASDNATKAFGNLATGIEGIAAKVPGTVEALAKLSKSFADTAQAYATSFGNLPAFSRLAEKYANPAEIKKLEDKLNSPLNGGTGTVGAGKIEGIDILRKAMLDRMPGPKAPSGPTKPSMFDEADAINAKALAVKPISLKDYKVPGEKDKGGGSEGKEKLDAYEREVAAIGKRTRAFDSERESVGKSALEVAKAEAAFRLLEAAEKANVPVTDDLRLKIDGLATTYAKAKVALDEAQEKQREFENSARQTGAVLSDGFKDAVLNGEKLINIIDKLLKSLASKGIDSVFDSLFSKTGAGTGLIKTALGGFAGGGYTGPGGKHTPAGVVHKGEIVWSQDDIRRFGGLAKVEAMRRGARGYADGGIVGALVPTQPGRITAAGRSGGGRLTYTNAPTYNIAPANGVTAAELRTVLASYDAEVQRTFGQRLERWRLNH